MLKNKFDFNDLFTFDLANNHQGSVEHGLNIIREIAAVSHRHEVKGAIKFQFRQLDRFIHASHQEGSEHKQVHRFLSTRLEPYEFSELLDEVRKQSLLAMCTPFDEESVDVILDMDFDIIKVASCSAKDWPLLEKIAEAGKPVVFSTGGLTLNDIDHLVSFFEHRGVDFAIMHCVSIYPTPDRLCHLNQIDLLKARYPDRPIGWSTHEDPADTAPVQIAVAKGATLFERHVGVPTEQITLNAYSSTPEQVDAWIASYKKAKTLCGSRSRPEPTEGETQAIASLQRGVFVKERIIKGTPIEAQQVYFAIPYIEGQLNSGAWKNGMVAREDLEIDTPIFPQQIDYPENPEYLTIKQAIHETKALLNEAKIALNSEFKVEYSHHYGIKNFRETGAIIIECINREYCKKLIVQLPGQEHPLHFHKRKEETFQVLFGVLHAEVDGHYRALYPGETLLVQSGVWHKFWTETGTVFEEISTTHYNDDSYYKDKQINRMLREQRKTLVDHWGRFELLDI
ncbi:MAG: N-acetylneuraminate synthase family protein [Cyanobacteria bacterium P01_E01_bin.42]